MRGRCLGGGFEIALACDFIFAEASASFGLPEIALGVFPPAASALLPARVGAARATSAILTGQPLPAEEWLRAGLLEAVVAATATLAGGRRSLVRRAPAPAKSAAALRHATAAARLGMRQRRPRAMLPELERLYLDDLMSTADAREGIAAFLEKRAPATGRIGDVRWNLTSKSCCARPTTRSTERDRARHRAAAPGASCDVEIVLKQILLAIDRAKNPAQRGALTSRCAASAGSSSRWARRS